MDLLGALRGGLERIMTPFLPNDHFPKKSASDVGNSLRLEIINLKKYADEMVMGENSSSDPRNTEKRIVIYLETLKAKGEKTLYGKYSAAYKSIQKDYVR